MGARRDAARAPRTPPGPELRHLGGYQERGGLRRAAVGPHGPVDDEAEIDDGDLEDHHQEDELPHDPAAVYNQGMRPSSTRTVLIAATGDAVARISADANGGRVSLALEGTGAQAVAVDPIRAGTIFVGCRGGGVRRSGDGGESWKELAFPARDVFSMAVSPVDGAVYAGCEPSALFRSDDGGETWRELEALRALPSAPTWSFPPRPWTSHVRAIAPSPHEADRILVGIELGGLMLSEDGGESWHDHRPDAQKDVHALAWHPTASGRAYEAGGGGAAWSVDAGRTWRRADAGRDRHYTYALAVDPDEADSWYVSASPGPMQAHYRGNAEAHVYRWRGDGPWERLAGGLPDPLDSMPYAMTASNGHLYAGLADGRLYGSGDRGDTWHELSLTGPRLSRIVALAGLSSP